MTSTPSPVVVGVDGSPSSIQAVRYAVAEAARLEVGVRLVHVSPDYTPTTPMLPLIRDDFEQVGRKILGEALGVVAEVDPGCEVSSVLRTGPTVTTLLDAAEGAHLVALGRQHRSRAEAVFTGSTTVGAAGRADCPVVCVPPTWSDESTRGRVVVGVRSPAHSTELLGQAFAAARLRGARLVVLHAWKLPGAYDDIVEARTHADDRALEMEREIDPLLETFRQGHPDVEVELSVVHEQPVRALLRAAAGAELLVVVRRAHGLPLTSHLGGTGRTLLREAECPVEVVPPQEVLAEMEGLVLEEAGDVRK
ncbi:universal stress protein [Nocardioides sp. MAHUQ-72]|uniref:universal stress protein n=1 Tax=unclassified Nocardioides TaxID=2615069 RepID=UPI00362362D3